MRQIENTQKIDSLAERALAGRGVGSEPALPHHRPAVSVSPCDILRRLGQTIQLMRLDHTDAHLYRDGCDALVEQAVSGSQRSGLQPALAQVMRLVEQADYHWALRELRMISQQEWHTC
jgi:hypothetical protein